MKQFSELGLSQQLLEAVTELGFENPMPVQEAVIPFLLDEGEKEHDLVALAQTGTGKTAAFGLPLLQGIDTSTNATQALILSPTRELCLQIAEDLKDYARRMEHLWVLAVYGGASIRHQTDILKKGVQIIVATPGRLLDLMDRGFVDLAKVRTVIMDEADEMLDMGFIDDIDKILAAAPQERRTLLFSATMPEEVEELSKRFMHDPKEIVIGDRNEGAANVRHVYYMVRQPDRYQTLKRLIDFYPKMYGIVFCRTKAETAEVAERLIRDGYSVDALHGDLSQAQRDYVMRRFRLHGIQLLVATDVAARGLDVDDLTHVINYTLPDENEIYIHRSGRTGRAGKTGISIAIIGMRELKRIRTIEQEMGKTFEEGKVPTGKDICNKQVFNLLDRLEKVDVPVEDIADMMPSVLSRTAWMDKDELMRRLVSLEFNRILGYYKENGDIETVAEEDIPKPGRRNGRHFHGRNRFGKPRRK